MDNVNIDIESMCKPDKVFLITTIRKRVIIQNLC